MLNLPNSHFIYGGSVNENNIKEYVVSDEIEGFLIGGASLDPTVSCILLNILKIRRK